MTQIPSLVDPNLLDTEKKVIPKSPSNQLKIGEQEIYGLVIICTLGFRARHNFHKF